MMSKRQKYPSKTKGYAITKCIPNFLFPNANITFPNPISICKQGQSIEIVVRGILLAPFINQLASAIKVH